MKIRGETTTEHSRFECEFRNCGKYGHKAADCWYKQTTKSQDKGQGTGKSKSKVTEINESDSSKRILIQITFDVMNVRKPLLGTSALKHRGVTIIFNHDYDRIIFRNETVDLVSHDCHSYLHVILTIGIPPCKGLVMAGENATKDVDEEVYDNDGDERNEAREASAGDRRAIADADQAGQLDISGEAKTARSLRTPEPPTDAARMAHNAAHVQFRDWCPICVASRGRSSPHRRVVVNKTADTLPKFQTDRLHVHSNSGREQNSAMYHIGGNAQWSGDQLHVRSERWLRGSDEGNPATF